MASQIADRFRDQVMDDTEAKPNKDLGWRLEPCVAVAVVRRTACFKGRQKLIKTYIQSLSFETLSLKK